MVIAPGRMRAVLRWPAAVAALAVVLATAGSAPTRAEPADDAALHAQCQAAAQGIKDQYRDSENVAVAVLCRRPDGTPVDPAQLLPAAPSKPAPIPVTTAGHTGCVTGPGRPVASTALTRVSATATTGEPLVYEYEPLTGGDTINSSGSAVLEFGPGDLAPGGRYRWRARVEGSAEQAADDVQAWSPWCEFTVSADAVDYRGLGDVDLEALNELGLRPDREYVVSLSARRQRLLREGTDIGRTSARMTLTGPRWTDLLVQLTEWAAITDATAAELDEGDTSFQDGTAYRELVDTISVKLGGPPHPDLG